MNIPYLRQALRVLKKKKTGSGFTAYYHAGDETNANKALAVLEQAGMTLYKEYLGYEPKNIPAYLAVSVKEYVKIADFPGGESNVEIGAGSAPGVKFTCTNHLKILYQKE